MSILKARLRRIPHFLSKIFVLIFLVFFATTVKAQIYIDPANHTDNTLTGATSVNTINCDLIDECPGVSQYSVIAWDDNSGSGVRAYFDVLYNGASIMGPIALPAGSEKPDVMIGTLQLPFSATIPRVGLIYQLGNDVYLDHWIVDITQTSPNKITHASGAPWKLNSDTAGSPHIDGLIDYSNSFPICQTNPALAGLGMPDSIAVPRTDAYVTTWHEYNATAGVYEVRSFTNNLGAAVTSSTPAAYWATIASPGKFPDVAFQRLYTTTTTSRAYFTYTTDNPTAGQDLWVTEMQPYGVILNTVSLETGKAIYAPRIEAQGWMDTSNAYSLQLWKVGVAVGPASGGTINGIIYDATGSAQIYPGYGSDIRVPVVAAGAGFLSPTYNYTTFSQFYPFAFYAPYSSHYHMGITATYSAGIWNMLWELNSSTISLSSPDPYAVGLAVTNNTGMNVLAAWFDGSNIQYKISEPANPYNTLWKPSSVENTERGDADIYPNPASEKLTITGAGKTTDYSISDITGRPLQSGQLSKANNTIEIGGLPQGMYIIRFLHDGKTEQRKFMKQ